MNSAESGRPWHRAAWDISNHSTGAVCNSKGVLAGQQMFEGSRGGWVIFHQEPDLIVLLEHAYPCEDHSTKWKGHATTSKELVTRVSNTEGFTESERVLGAYLASANIWATTICSISQFARVCKRLRRPSSTTLSRCLCLRNSY